jgi:hypothetical protein
VFSIGQSLEDRSYKGRRKEEEGVYEGIGAWNIWGLTKMVNIYKRMKELFSQMKTKC